MLFRYVCRALLLLITGLCLGAPEAKADRLKKFVLYGSLNEKNDSTGWHELDSVEVSLTRSDTIPVPFKLLSPSPGDTTLTQHDMKLLVDGGRGTYQLRLYKPGFDPLLREVRVTAVHQDQVWAGWISMQREKNIQLHEVEVRATAIKMVVKGDTIVYNADAFQLAQGSMLDELVRQLPGAELTEEGQIKVNGRVLSELLINGKDFFKGDANVALKNMPAYAVKNVKVYDKASDDAYLTHSNVRLNRTEEEENLVMDVILKKEFSRAYMGNIEVGYGTDNRYDGRIFGLTFNEKVRLSAYGNFNNVMDRSEASTDSYWGGSAGGSGEETIKKGGADFLWEDGKWKSTGNVKVAYDNTFQHSQTSSVNYYDSGDVWQRSESRSNTRKRSFSFDNYTHFKGDAVFVSVKPKVSYSDEDNDGTTRSATFSAMPEEAYRVQSLDSIFAGKHMYDDNLTFRLGKLYLSRPRHLNAGMDVNATIRPESMKGILNVDAWGNYSDNHYKTRNVYDQTMGPNSTVAPVRRDEFRENPNPTTRLGAQTKYRYEKVTFNNNFKTNWGVHLALKHEYQHTFNGVDLLTATGADVGDFFPPTGVVMPSLMEAAGAVPDEVNTHFSHYVKHASLINANYSWERSTIVESDSGINPTFSFSLHLNEHFLSERVNWRELTRTLHTSRHKAYLRPYLVLNFKSSNKKRYMGLRGTYEYHTTYPDIFLLLGTINSTDPMSVWINDGTDLKTSHRHKVDLSFNYYGRKGAVDYMYSSLNVSVPRNSLVQSRRYDPATGISYYRRENINGNISGDFYGSINVRIDGKEQQDSKWSASVNVNESLSRSMDYVTATSGDPVLSRIDKNNFGGGLNLYFRFMSGSTVSAGGNVSRSLSHSNQSYFYTPNITRYGVTFSCHLRLPRDFNFNTDLRYGKSHGYNDPTMDDAQWTWNAHASKYFPKQKLVIKLSAVDILGQVKDLRYWVNSYGRTEMWTLSMPRYVMLSVTWRFNHNPGKIGS